MAREISPVCDFIFGSIRTSLLTEMVGVDLTIRMVKGIYMYCKDHTTELTIFTLWSTSVIPFPLLRQKIQAFKDNKSKKTQQCHGIKTLLRCPEIQENMPLAK